MSHERLDTAKEDYDQLIDQLLDSLTADSETFSGIIGKMPAAIREYRSAAREALNTATDEWQIADYGMTVDKLSEHTAAILVTLNYYRNRKGLMRPSSEI